MFRLILAIGALLLAVALIAQGLFILAGIYHPSVLDVAYNAYLGAGLGFLAVFESNTRD